jgi:alkanesulfonate monooxygenase SsuD/methylene tetrahydromethanopterin reductase-like flavin-dependent oxidoreductase (luciferase family)
MKFGVLYNIDYHQEVHGSHADYYEAILQQIERMEELGYHSVWFGEHHYAHYSFGVPSLMCQAAADRTKRIKVGTGVSLLPLQHPVRQAEEFAILDVLSGGRLEYGIGRGYLKWAYDIMGIDEAESVDRYREAMDIIVALWSSDAPVSYQGQFWDVRDYEIFPKPLQSPVPIYATGASTESSYALAGEKGLNLCCPFFLPNQPLVQKGIQSYRTALRGQGIDPSTRSIMGVMPMYCAESEQEARDAFQYTLNYLQFFGSLDQRSPHRAKSYEAYIKGAAQMGDATYEAFDEANLALIGTPSNIISTIEWVLEYFDGPDYIIMEVAQGGMHPSRVVPVLERFANEVMVKFPEPAEPSGTTGKR